jgi:hypothetical protein
VLHASTREFLHEFIGHYVALEGKLWGSLKRLIFQPGELTNEYIRGRRVRYVQPLRMYLTFSVLFFALLKFTADGGTHVDAKLDGQTTAAKVVAPARAGARRRAAGQSGQARPRPEQSKSAARGAGEVRSEMAKEDAKSDIALPGWSTRGAKVGTKPRTDSADMNLNEEYIDAS